MFQFKTILINYQLVARELRATRSSQVNGAMFEHIRIGLFITIHKNA